MLMSMMAGGGGPVTPSDPYWDNVVSLLRFQGTHGSTAFTDEKGKLWSGIGAARIEVSGGESYGMFDGGGITTPDHPDFNFGADPFCLEVIVTPSSVSSVVKHICGQFGSTPNMCVQLYLWSTTAGAAAAASSSGAYDSSFDVAGTLGVMSVGTKAHVALVRDGNQFKIYVEGVLRLTKTDARTLYNSTKSFYVGRNDHLSNQTLLAKMHGFRATKGVPRYTGPFTPPTSFST